MGLASLQVCMDSSDWLQGAIHEESNGIMMMDSSSSPSGEMLTCSRPPGGSSASASASSSAAAAAAASALMQEQSRRLRPPHDTSLKCPRCDSTHTKFCYYNNYSLSQPRYFCKTCRRYWTKGGTLRNIPVGGGCRKNNTTNTTTNNNNKKNPSSASSSTAATKKTSSNDHLHPHPHLHHHQHQHHHESMISPSSSSQNPIDLHLSITDMHLNNLLHGGSFMDNNPITRPIDFLGNADQLGMMGGVGVGGGYGDYLSFTNNHGVSTNFDNHHHGPICPPFGISLHDGGASPFMENNCQRLMGFSYDEENHQNAAALVLDDVKPNTKLLSLDNWQDHHHQQQQQQQHHHLNGFGSWTGMMMNNNNTNGFGSSTIS